MADNRGGYRQPRDKRPKVAGPGKAARRTDNQPIQVANVQESTDLQVGDRQKLENAQRIAPLGRLRPPRVAAVTPPESGGSAALPEHLFSGPTSRPGEPITAGMDFGPGPGSEAITPPPPETDQEIVLDFLAREFNDQAAAQMLSEIRNARAVPDEPMEAPIASAAPVEAPEPEPIELDTPETEEIPEEPIEEPVEEPVV